MMSTQATPFLTPEQYLEIERAAETRSEYRNGTMYPPALSTLDHVRVTMAGLHSQLCVRQHNLIAYPDVFLTCRPFHCKDTLPDATVIAEVLSPSTKNYDRGEKFQVYRGLVSIRDYLVVSQDRSDETNLKSIDYRLRPADVFEQVEFETAS